MRVAKNYEKYETVGEPYEAHQHWYQKININGQITEVRLYSDAEYEKMYPSNLVPIKEQLGFQEGAVSLIDGNTSAVKDWLSRIGARYHKLFGWYAPLQELDGPVPEGITLYPLSWKQISVNNKYLRPDNEIVEIVSSIKYGKSASDFIGQVGDKISKVLRVKKVIKLDTRYGETNMHIMEDSDENIYVWITNTRNLVEDQLYSVFGTIKAHEIYKGEKRTILVRCQVEEMKCKLI